MRRLTLAVAVLATLASGLWLQLDPRSLLPSNAGSADLLRAFLAGAVQPALYDQGSGQILLVGPVLSAAWSTVVFASAGMGLALVLAMPLSAMASTRFTGGGWLCGATRTTIAGMRSVHELLWAVLLLAALGLTQVSAVIAIAIPYAGTLAKVFSELLDEAPTNAANALDVAGATRLQALCFGLLPRAFPDLAAYGLYRFECALRSSAVLGFFGFPTLGYAIATSADHAYFREVWTYLYALFALIWLVDRWSWAVRRRMVRA